MTVPSTGGDFSTVHRYQLSLSKRHFLTRKALRGDTFLPPASKPGPKLYVVVAGTEPIYIGTTVQPIASRLRYGWSARGKNGYHGYQWRKKYRRVRLDIWFPRVGSGRTGRVNLETIEAEVVYELRRRRRRWPRYQTEIHFHAANAHHRRTAGEIVGYYLATAAHNTRVQRTQDLPSIK